MTTYLPSFGMAWDHEEGKGKALKPWLDPVNSGEVALGGYNPSSSESVKISSGKQFQVFPNPARERFFITSKEPLNGRGRYSIINLSGVRMLLGELDGDGRAEIQSSSLSPGIYLVRVGVDGYYEHHKILVTGQ